MIKSSPINYEIGLEGEKRELIDIYDFYETQCDRWVIIDIYTTSCFVKDYVAGQRVEFLQIRQNTLSKWFVHENPTVTDSTVHLRLICASKKFDFCTSVDI